MISWLNAVMEIQNSELRKAGIAHQVVGDPTLFDVVFIDQPVKKYRDVLKADSDLNIKYNKALRKRGLFKATGKCYPSLALSDEDIELRLRSSISAAFKPWL